MSGSKKEIKIQKKQSDTDAGWAAQFCEYDTEVLLIPVPKVGISKTSSRVGCKETFAACTQAPGDRSLGKNKVGDDLKTASVPRRGPESLGVEGNQAAAPSVFRHRAEELE